MNTLATNEAFREDICRHRWHSVSNQTRTSVRRAPAIWVLSVVISIIFCCVLRLISYAALVKGSCNGENSDGLFFFLFRYVRYRFSLYHIVRFTLRVMLHLPLKNHPALLFSFHGLPLQCERARVFFKITATRSFSHLTCR